MGKLALYVTLLTLSTASVCAEELTLRSEASDQSFNAIAAGPESAEVGVLILHDWFGISDLTMESVNWMGKRGVRTIAVDLYGGETATTHEEANKLSTALDPDNAQEGARAGLAALGAGERPVAVVGYSMGGRIALRAAAENPDLVQAVGLIYAGGFEGIDDEGLSQAGPILAVTGSADSWSYEEHALLEKRLRDLGGAMEVYIYPGADHAFAQPLYNEGKSYDREATMAMRNVLENFLGRHLGGPMQTN